jgi:hypothetical protein
MKKSLPIASIVVLLAISCARAADDALFPADITHGNIRCVLMSVGQTTVFSSSETLQGIAGGPDGKQGVPCLTVTLLMESFGDAPTEPSTLKSVEILSAGKPVRIERALTKPYSQMSSSQKWFSYDFFQSFLDFGKPKVTNPKRAVIVQFSEFGSVSRQQGLSLVIEGGFDQDIQKFEFDSIQIQ